MNIILYIIIPEKRCHQHVFSDKNCKIVLKILFMFARDMRRQKVYVIYSAVIIIIHLVNNNFYKNFVRDHIKYKSDTFKT